MITTDTRNDVYSQLDLSAEQQDLINRVGVLARENFAARAAEYDRTATFPAEDFDDLFREGLLAPVVPKEHGGYGLGPYTGDVFTLWMMTKEIASADLSLARCWEGHVNSLVLLDGMATQNQNGWRGVVNHKLANLTSLFASAPPSKRLTVVTSSMATRLLQPAPVARNGPYCWSTRLVLAAFDMPMPRPSIQC
jgi:hypothetical protein